MSASGWGFLLGLRPGVGGWQRLWAGNVGGVSVMSIWGLKRWCGLARGVHISQGCVGYLCMCVRISVCVCVCVCVVCERARTFSRAWVCTEAWQCLGWVLA